MSHTDKDRPYWVKANDPTLPRHEDHNHFWFGKTYTRKRRVRDANGAYLFDVTIEHVPVVKDNMDWYLSWEGRQATDCDPLRHPRDRMRFYRYEYRERWEPLFEHYTVTYGEHCTIDEPNTAVYTRRDQPCSMALDHWYYGPYGGGPDKFHRQQFNGSQRRRDRDDLRAYVKEVNATPDWSDLDDSQLPHDRHRHTIVWW